MATNIEWTDETINFWVGCEKVSQGCKFCYMYRDLTRYGKDPMELQQVAEKTIRAKLKKLAPGSKIFTCSWSDFFWHQADHLRTWAWDIIRNHPQFIWQILTKRPERILENLPPDWGNGWQHVWLGVSVEDEKTANERIWELLQVPSETLFLSLEPLLGHIEFENLKDQGGADTYNCLDGTRLFGSKDSFHAYKDLLDRILNYTKIDWVIVGGESGNDTGPYGYRETKLEWILSAVKQCQENHVPVFVKQLGTHLAKELKLKDRKGGNMFEWPEELQIRQFPKR